MGGDGEKAKNLARNESGAERSLALSAGAKYDPRLRELMTAYGSGKSSLGDILSQASQLKAGPSARQQSLQAELASLQGQPLSSGPSHQGDMLLQTAGMPAGSGPQEDRMMTDPDTNKQISVKDRINNIQSELKGLDTPYDYSTALTNEIAVDPLLGSRLATDQVRSNPLTSGFFGDGGLQDRLSTEEQNLASRGWSMQPEDQEAYGQASGNIARQYAQEEGSLARSLAARGMGGGSGAALKSYSGLMGNKNERLSQAQRQIADDRMRMNLDRLNSTRNVLMQTGQLGQSALNAQFGRNLAGVQQRQGQDTTAANFAQQGRAMDQAQENAGFQQIQDTKGPSFGDIMGGLGTGLLGAATGGLGTAIGGGLGGILGGSSFSSGAADAMKNYGKKKGEV